MYVCTCNIHITPCTSHPTHSNSTLDGLCTHVHATHYHHKYTFSSYTQKQYTRWSMYVCTCNIRISASTPSHPTHSNSILDGLCTHVHATHYHHKYTFSSYTQKQYTRWSMYVCTCNIRISASRPSHPTHRNSTLDGVCTCRQHTHHVEYTFPSYTQ